MTSISRAPISETSHKYRLDYLTPYWDPEGGFRVDAVYESGLAGLVSDYGVHKLTTQLSFVQSAPDLSHLVGSDVPVVRPVLEWFADTRFAFHYNPRRRVAV